MSGLDFKNIVWGQPAAPGANAVSSSSTSGGGSGQDIVSVRYNGTLWTVTRTPDEFIFTVGDARSHPYFRIPIEQATPSEISSAMTGSRSRFREGIPEDVFVQLFHAITKQNR